MRITSILSLLMLVLVISACLKNERDEDKPRLNLSLENNQDQVVSSGGFVNFQISCADDLSLAEVRVEAKCLLSNWNPSIDPDSAIQVFPTLGETLVLSSSFQLVENLYTEICTLTLTCIDGEGNESNSESFDFQVRNVFDSSGPTIKLIDSVLVDGVFIDGIEVESGTPFKPNGTAIDDSSVDLVYLEVLNSTQSIGAANEQDFSSDNLMEVEFSDLQLTAPGVPGEYSLLIGAIDSLNNSRERSYPLFVLE